MEQFLRTSSKSVARMQAEEGCDDTVHGLANTVDVAAYLSNTVIKSTKFPGFKRTTIN